MNQTPQPPPARQSRAGAVVIFGLIVAALIGVIAVIGAFSGDDNGDTPGTPPAATPERLCELLREGYTPGTLGYNGKWRTWPDSVSGRQRGLDIGAAAIEGGCADLL